MIPKVYIGDGVYAQIDEFSNLILTTENGIEITNRIVLDPEVTKVLLDLLES